jgi:hypothetical protein
LLPVAALAEKRQTVDMLQVAAVQGVTEQAIWQ